MVNSSLSRGRKLEKRSSGDFELVPAPPDGRFVSGFGTSEFKEEKKESLEVLELRKQFEAAKALAKSLFKADRPYRCRLSYIDQIVCTTGVLNYQVQVANVTSVQEWSAIDTLFDEVFVHSLTVHFYPFNSTDTRPFATNLASTSHPGVYSVTTSQTVPLRSVGIIGICLFGAPSYFSSSAGMLNTPTRKTMMSSDRWSYVWRNNVRYDPRGLNLSSGAQIGWNGWTQVSDTSTIGGAVQFRVINDLALEASTTCTLGTTIIDYDVSFRVRL